MSHNNHDDGMQMSHQPFQLIVSELTFSWRRGEPVLNRLCLPPLPSGQLVCVIGRNGAGKTTFFRLLTGTLPMQSGSIDAGGITPYLVPQDPELGFAPGMTVLETALARAKFSGKNLRKSDARKKLQLHLEQLGYGQLVARIDSPPASFSGGELQAIGLATAALAGARLVCLDEPTSRVDDASREPLWLAMGRLAQLGALVVVISHDYEMVQHHADTILELAKGELAQCTDKNSIG